MIYVFDNDGTLYADKTVHAEFKKVFAKWGSEKLMCESEMVWMIIDQLKIKWSTDTPALALANELGISFDAVVEETYQRVNISRANVVSEKSIRKTILERLNGPKIVLTNSPSQFTRRILSTLGVSKFFETIVGIKETGFLGKPNSDAYLAVEQLHPCTSPGHILFFDDSLQNLDAASSRGWKTIHVSHGVKNEQTTHHEIDSINDILSIRL